MKRSFSVRQLNTFLSLYSENKLYQEDKEITVAVVEKNALLVKYADEKLKDDFDVGLTAVSSDGRTLAFLSDRLRGEIKIVLAAVSRFCPSYAYARLPAAEDRKVAEAVAKNGGDTVALLPDKFLRDKSIALIAAGRNPKAVRFFSDEVRADGEVASSVLRADRTAAKFLADEAFFKKEVFELAVKPENGKINGGTINDDTPLGVFEAARSRGVKINLAAQNINYLTLDRDKFLALLDCADGVIPKKNEVFHRFVDEDDRQVILKLTEMKLIAPARAQYELKYASQNRKSRVLPALIAYSSRSIPKPKERSERDNIIRGLKRRSAVTYKKLIEKIGEYIDDEEVLSLASLFNGEILKYMNNSRLIGNDRIVNGCIKNLVVKNSEAPILSFLPDFKPTFGQAKALCLKDGRNYIYLSDELKSEPEIAAEAARTDLGVYESLPDELKNHPAVLARRIR
ncbi:MAG: DUF4116 domain-containing protein [Clostridia bacterium]|nr:DUF4116 domain-containing protein [Clostridia bacterium]